MTIVYETLSLPTERLIVSCPLAGADGGEKRPAFLVKKLRELFPDLTFKEERTAGGDFRFTAPRSALERAGEKLSVALALKELPEYAPLVERMEKAACQERGSLTRPVVETLYGSRAPMSASRLDKYRACHFAYFMQYGLTAKPRKKAEFAAADYGTFVHYVLEHILKERKKGSVPTREQVKAVVARYVEELGGLEGESARFRYLFARLEKSVFAVVKNVCEELDRSDFTPAWFELGFGGKEGTLPPVEFTADGFTVSVTGFVDRVDTWEKDGKVYFRVVDYKTGKKEFDFTDVWNGMSLQMLLYLFTLKEKGEELFGGKIPVPAGVLYLPARDEAVPGYRGMSEAERQKKVDKQLERHGLVLCEPEVLEAMEHGEEGYRFLPLKLNSAGEVTSRFLVTAEQLGRLERHTRQALEDVARELAAGKITADPFWRGERKNACLWCDYAAACQFREGMGGDKRRWLSTVSAEDFWEQLSNGKE